MFVVLNYTYRLKSLESQLEQEMTLSKNLKLEIQQLQLKYNECLSSEKAEIVAKKELENCVQKANLALVCLNSSLARNFENSACISLEHLSACSTLKQCLKCGWMASRHLFPMCWRPLPSSHF